MPRPAARRRAHGARGRRRGRRDAPTEIVVADGGPAEQLADASRQLDLLVVGSRRYGPLRRVLLGSVSSALIERVHCPMLIVPRGVHADLPADVPALA